MTERITVRDQDAPPERPIRTESRTWAEIGALAGAIAMVAYAVISTVQHSSPLAAVGASVVGPAIAAASAGLYEVLRLHRSTVSLKLGLGANVAAAITVTMMLLAQITYRGWLELRFPTGPAATSASPAYQAANGLQLGFDVAWDVFLCLGTVLFAVNMWTHPRFGRVFAITGGSLAALLLILNMATFPEPPDQAGLVDLGPLVGLWYVAVAIRIGVSLKWVDRRAAEVQIRSSP